MEKTKRSGQRWRLCKRELSDEVKVKENFHAFEKKRVSLLSDLGRVVQSGVKVT